MFTVNTLEKVRNKIFQVHLSSKTIWKNLIVYLKKSLLYYQIILIHIDIFHL